MISEQALQAPLPADEDIKTLRGECEFIQRELISINSKIDLPKQMPKDELTIPEWSSFEDGITRLLQARSKLIVLRSILAQEITDKALVEREFRKATKDETR